MEGDLQQLLREFGLKDAIACLKQNGVYDHVRMSMLTEHEVDDFGHRCNLKMMTARLLKEKLPDLVQRSLDRPDKDGVTALMRASRQGHSEVVGKLLEKGASVDVRDKDGKTAVDFAGKDASCRALVREHASCQKREL